MELEYLRSIGICVEEPVLNLQLAVASETELGKVRDQGSREGHGRRGREFRISKTLSQILRHRAMELDIDVRPDGYCLLQEVLECPWVAGLQVTQSDVEKIVEGNDKKRFELKDEDGKLMIRATQGHSMKIVEDNELLKGIDLINLPACCVHGTYRKHVGSIMQKGLLAGGKQGQGFRNHVHFSSFSPGDNRVISGMRTDCEIAIWIDLKRAIEDGVPFYLSSNQVILSPGINGAIDKKYFMKVQDLQKKEDLPLDL